MSKSKTRLNISVPYRTRNQLEALLEMEVYTSYSETIRRGIDLIMLVVNANEEGKQLIVRDAEGNEHEIVLL